MPATDVRKLVQDAAYVSVGVGVLAFQKAQVARREAQAILERQVKETRETAKGAQQRLESTVGDVRSRIEPLADQVQQRLPEPIVKLVEAGRSRLQSNAA